MWRILIPYPNSHLQFIFYHLDIFPISTISMDNEVVLKRCTGCNAPKTLDKYENQKGGAHGKRAKCKECRKTKKNEYGRKHYNNNKEAESTRKQQYYVENREQILERTKTYQKENREIYNENAKHRRATDP